MKRFQKYIKPLLLVIMRRLPKKMGHNAFRSESAQAVVSFDSWLLVLGSVISSVITISGCKQLYDPEIDNENTALVVQGILTNTPGELSVRISKAVSFDSVDSRAALTGATVSITDDLGNTIPLFMNSLGSYVNPAAVGIPGRTYKLYITTVDGEVYESESQTMAGPYKQDTIYGNYSVQNRLMQSINGDYSSIKIEGVETFVDLSSGSDELPRCRYDVNVTVLYVRTSETKPPLVTYCWRSFDPNNTGNITTSKFDRNGGIIKQHSLGFFGNELYLYASDGNLSLAGWLLSFTKYDISHETQVFYKDIQNQLASSGKIFDPIPAQLKSNMHCESNSAKMVLGFFEVSHSEKQYYHYALGKDVFLEKRDSFPGFTKTGESLTAPPFWQ